MKISTKGKKIFKLSCILLILATLAIGGCSFVSNVILAEPTQYTYEFSGYVYADNSPLADAKVSCGISQTTTDENGYYKFSNLSKVVQVNVSKDGYLFDNNLVYVKANNSNVNFSGYKYFDMNGVVKNANEVIPFATIKVVSKAGTFYTTSNEFGEFYLPKLAGVVEIEATHEDIKFFSQSFDITKEDLIINGTTTVRGEITTDIDAEANQFSLTLNDEEVLINDDLTFEIDNVSVDSVLKLTSSDYHIEDSETIIQMENREIIFNCEKFYNISGVVKSGNTSLNDAKIVVEDFDIEITNNNGTFGIENLYGDRIIKAQLNGFDFEEKTVNNSSEEIEFIGTFDINGQIITDDNTYENISVSLDDEISYTDSMGKFVFENVQLNQVIKVSNENYFIENNDREILDFSEVTFNLYRYYDFNLSVSYRESGLDCVNVNFDGTEYVCDSNLTIEKVYGERDFSLELNGYKFEESYKANLNNSNISITPYKYYDLHCIVKSGDLIIENAELDFGENKYYTDENGEFELKDIYLSGEILISKDKYNETQISFDIDNNELEINLEYDIVGKITSNGLGLADVEVLYGESKIITDKNGNFEIKNLKGTNLISFEKEYYNFESVQVSYSQNLDISSTYNIEGNVSDSLGNISDFKVLLIDVDSDTTLETETDENGNYYFNNLTGEYLLVYDMDANISLKPNSYDISKGGSYNFADNGYGFSGRVTCGGLPLADVVVSAGDIKTTTNENGYYKFDLLTKPSILILSKEGYTFESNGREVSDELDAREDINFSATYKISGNIKSGNQNLSNVLVSVNGITTLTDANGNYEISGLSGKINITVSLDNFFFEGVFETNVSAVLNFEGFFETNIKILSGELAVDNVELVLNGNSYFSNNGSISLSKVAIGEEFVLIKSGYNFESSYIFQGYSENGITINCSYNLNGIVYSGSKALLGVKVTCNEIEVLTNEQGEFTLLGLTGENEVCFELVNYEFDSIKVASSESVEVYAKFSVNGYVKVGETPLMNVIVSNGEVSTKTNALGYFELKNLNRACTLSFTKTGYSFSSVDEVDSPITLNVSASYSLIGYVLTGYTPVEGVLVTSSNQLTTYTDSEGRFEINGLEENVTLAFEKDGYDKFTSETYSEYTSNIVVSMQYSVIINFSGVDDYSNIAIAINGVKSYYSSSQVTLTNLSGENRLSFSKTNYLFSPSEYVVESHLSIDVTMKIVYTATGWVKTENELPVSGATIYAGGYSVTTDSNGKYTIGNLSNTTQLILRLETESYTYEKIYGQINSTGVYDFSIPNLEYGYYMFLKGYENLENANTYQIYGEGVVQPRKFSGPQSVKVIYKKDANNIRLFQNLNHGDVVEIPLIITVDPRVSMLTYIDMNNKTVKYQRVTGDSVSTDKATYSTNWTDSTYSDFINNFGINPEGFYPYNINKNTISSISSIAINESGEFVFTISLKPTTDTYGNYAKQMKLMVSEQDLDSFEKIELTYTIYPNGFIKQMVINETYTVVSMSQSVITDASITYNFLTTSLYESIPNIDVSSASAIENSLKQSEPTVNTLTYAFDLFIPNKRRVLE